LVFTDFTDLSFHPDAVREVVSLATSTDGVSFPLYPKNPVVAGPPAGFGPTFRDPKVFRDPSDGMWKMVLSSGRDGKGRVFIFQSADLTTWSYLGLLYTGDGSTGDSFECPNFFPLDDKWVLIYGGNGLGWWETGRFNGSVFTSEKRGLFDHGPASYATQWYKDSKGRNLAIAWMGNWSTPKWASRLNGWAGQQSVTRELFLTGDGSLGSRPVAELDSLSNGRVKELGPRSVNGNAFTVGSSNTARVKVTLNLAQTTASSFILGLAQSAAEAATLTYEVASGKLTIDTTRAGYAQPGTWSATIPQPKDGKVALDIFIDRSSVEVFSSDGTVISALVWPVYRESKTVQIVAQGGVAAFERLSFVQLGSSWC
jgi:sucrose-6-phosphate hydrolase SacC (GH32 family)